VDGLGRWGCTPLQEAVRSGRNLLAEIIRTKGGTLPADVGAIQICSAASKGDVPALQLLHLCGVRSDVGDYDFRCPLHLAAAEARILAVSFLLVISANPSCTGLTRNFALLCTISLRMTDSRFVQIDGEILLWMTRTGVEPNITSTVHALFTLGVGLWAKH
jgi:hypothetical protein